MAPAAVKRRRRGIVIVIVAVIMRVIVIVIVAVIWVVVIAASAAALLIRVTPVQPAEQFENCVQACSDYKKDLKRTGKNSHVFFSQTPAAKCLND
mmetsp:Transcript_11193/g.46702  ORF Transcript_11193/g.46702 Transcript_11193/m.46702 type:complete len:95 (+) Transcript_11193:562-846(+)